MSDIYWTPVLLFLFAGFFGINRWKWALNHKEVLVRNNAKYFLLGGVGGFIFGIYIFIAQFFGF